MNEKLLNISIRALVMISRFIFLFMLVKLLDPSDVGIYGLVVAAVGYSLYFVGLDFYTYTTREISSASKQYWGSFLKRQGLLTLLLYILVLPMLISLFYMDILPWSILKWFFFLVVLEHICLELMRFFIAASEQVTASIVLFLNQALWAVLVIGLMLLDESFRRLDYVLFFWLIGSSLAIVFSVFKIVKMNLGGWSTAVDFHWIVSGVKIAIPMLVATLAFRGVFTFDRYWLESLAGLDVVAAYVLFIGVAGTLIAFLDAAVFSFVYPKLIHAYKNDDSKMYKKCMREMLIFVSLFSVLFMIGSLLVFPYLLNWIDKPVYFQFFDIYYWVLAAMIINAFWMIFHYAIYSQRHDRHIVYSHLASIGSFLILAFVFSSIWGYYSILVALCVSQLIILIWKLFAYVHLTPKHFFGISSA
ncbi:MATE family efflux transporter [Nitrincola alkalisediminis]